ncbi:MAG: ribonuclease HII [Flavobacterium sp.]
MLQKFHTIGQIEAGTDEAGRGCLAGPVTAASVILNLENIDDENFFHSINDSKQLNEKTRLLLKPLIEKNVISYGFAHVFPIEIDEINILNASIKAMHMSIEKLNCMPQLILVDGNRFKKFKEIQHETIIKGDSKYLSIAAASILAKTYRDLYMEKIHEEYPMYNWKKNKGYPTKEHRAAIEKYGTTPYHRMSFKLLETQYKLEI